MLNAITWVFTVITRELPRTIHLLRGSGRHREVPPAAGPTRTHRGSLHLARATIAWPTPPPPHVRERQALLRGEDSALVRPYARAETTLQLPVVRERLRTAALVGLGFDLAHPQWRPGG
ncbi:hypothetical protein [Streptomyces sp. NPDC005953]|uniref:hypothetical protein n=1 Tax=Streptomyces sp. NPDC005953 TaxID=3156719 RepID=UPI0033E997DC